MRFVTLLIGAALLLFGILGMIGSWVVHHKHSEAFARGVRVEAEIERKYFLGVADGSSEYMIEYRFSLPSKVVQAGAAEVPKKTWQLLKTGDKVLLAYLPEEPTRGVLPELGAPSVLLPVFITAISIAVAVIGLVALIASARNPAQANAA